MSKKEKKFPSELRFDVVNKDWVVIATGRARRPDDFKKVKKLRKPQPKKNCPFCNIQSQGKPTLIFSSGKDFSSLEKIDKNWTTIVIPNKFPAFMPSTDIKEKKEGPFYKRINAAGFHEVVITRDHIKSLAELEIDRVKELFDAYQQRYLSLMKISFVNYISIFHNHGFEAGASISHPHSQIITTPLIDIDLITSLTVSKNYYKKEKKCIYCELNKWEIKNRKRIVFENKHFLAVCPFASKAAFQVVISPKKHLPSFENSNEAEKQSLAEIFKVVLTKLHKGLSDPAYNFYLHSAPCDKKDHSHYHYHWTIVPKTSIWGGFEMGPRMEISTVEPEKAAEYLRKQ